MNLPNPVRAGYKAEVRFRLNLPTQKIVKG